MIGSGILRNILERYPKAAIRASLHNLKPFIIHKQVEYVEGDLRSAEDCRRMVEGCDCAVMAAAHTGGAGFVVSKAWEHIKDNLIMNVQMLEAFRSEGIKRVIFVGSATLYQEFEGMIKEDHLDLNRDPNRAYLGFGWGLRFIEKLCRFLYEQNGTEVIIIRAANIFGPYAKFDPQDSNFIPAIIRKAADKMDPFEAWGSPDAARDVLYVDDFSRAVVTLLESDKYKFDIFNIGSGVKTKVAQVVEWALKYAKHSPAKIVYNPDKPASYKSLLLDCSKIKAAINWQPQYSVEEGIRKTAEWWEENKERWAR